ncbi:hypothetical protein JDV02_001483 [Purpureocillium takamizusanense]|uniref:Transcription factor Pcc1 n=1 Tax=Purpureocillium takamizusanense TaxID=2060973 RepID=A0A9Q8Q774_9HYPO|nr:uncharacterized protein JDV02_001483 [Purpureocillium takamizusanense]UNI14903.1 hypothetical protein JDV02_001483 [Purpureocillium takamizusanense]
MATIITTTTTAASARDDASFPCSIALRVPLPSARLASTALRALEVDPELSPLVRRHLSVGTAAAADDVIDTTTAAAAAVGAEQRVAGVVVAVGGGEEETVQEENNEALKVLHVDYRATTNRMLRVAVNSFLDSLKLVLEVMEQLDVDVLAEPRRLRQGSPPPPT